uniref:Scavenger receptor class B, member 2a n=1 Tax=Nothobranchius furzeri TaxID=105023 RepID=A0A8C6MGQ5_NOTFU
MTRRSCAIYVPGIVCVHLLLVAQAFQTSRLKRDKSQVFQAWKNPPPPVYMEFYFFNVTNPEVLLAGGKASVQQIGPYTYRAQENVTFLENGTKVYALNPKTRRSLVSALHCSLALMNDMETFSFILRTVVCMFVDSLNVSLFMTRTVHEILWGFKDPLLTKIHSLQPEVDEYFGLMWKKNSLYKEGLGSNEKIETWNSLRKMSWWPSSQSSVISGMEGAVFHPLINKNELLYIFAAELCRSIHLTYMKEVEVKGVRAYRFAPPADVLMSLNNAVACMLEMCLGIGVLKVGVCREGLPVVMSFPRFYQADKAYIDTVDGLKPQKEYHETYLDLQPTLGVPIRSCKRTQLNVLLKRFSGFRNMRYIQKTVFPILFVSEVRLSSLTLIFCLVSFPSTHK